MTGLLQHFELLNVWQSQLGQLDFFWIISTKVVKLHSYLPTLVLDWKIQTFFSTLMTSVRHMCWELEGGDVLLLGGFLAPLHTELVTSDGQSSSEGFPLQYSTE